MKNQQVVQNGRKQWVEPAVRQLSAGSAETGARANEDGNGDPLNARS